MSKIGKLPVQLKEGVLVSVENNTVTVNGPKGVLSYAIPSGIEVRVDDGKVFVQSTRKDDQNLSSLYGLTRANIANMVEGVTAGFEKKLKLSGVGYRAAVNGGDLVLSIGFSHPVSVKADEGIAFAVNENVISVLGIDKSLVGNVAARIRRIRPPEPYKGKGISYEGERIRRKAGKAAKAVGAK